MQDLMIDIETLGNSSDAVMIQLAGIYFDITTGERGEEFCLNISENSCVREGFRTSNNTLDWWATQDQSILDAIKTNAHDITYVIENFYNFYKKGGKVSVWSHATFDFVIVQNYLQKILGTYMHHRDARDIRTLVNLSGIDLTTYDWTKKTHNALDDCKFQIIYCVDALKKLRGGL